MTRSSEPSVRARRAAYERARYAADPSLRERIVTRVREKRHTDPGDRERQLRSSARWRMWRRKRTRLVDQLAWRGFVLAGGLG